MRRTINEKFFDEINKKGKLMKTLILMRHAKSSWKDQKIKDKDRPLTKRGMKDAVQIGTVLEKNELIPQLVLSSSVKRARQTAELVLEACHYPGEVIFMEKLFLAEADVILDALRLLPNEVERVLVIGHNPGMESVLQILTGQIVALPAGAAANISLLSDLWKSLGLENHTELIQLWRPKNIK
jgi:phosphohistidine phosphatase